MNSLACAFAAYLLNALWIVPLAAAAAWLAARILRKLGPRAQHLVWIVALVLAVVLPIFPLLGSLLASARASARIVAPDTLLNPSAVSAA
ncbi:MAG: hypothetical protein WCC14_13935, partial [Acidobacteriaceae bacterium]